MTDKKITKVKRRRDESLESYIDRQRKLDESLKASAEEEKRRKFREEHKEPPETALIIIFSGIATVAAVMFIRGDIQFSQKAADVSNTKSQETIIYETKPQVAQPVTPSNIAPRQEVADAMLDVYEQDVKYLCRMATALNDNHSATRADSSVIVNVTVKCFEATQKLDAYKRNK